ncbi:MAG: hypothetical protein QOJ49_1095 [Actinomycetota bacterium]|nr:hypothetical protein [Actinomycetota bacterium]
MRNIYGVLFALGVGMIAIGATLLILRLVD